MKKRVYGGDNTIHKTGHLDVEVNYKGEIIAVWFRCQHLPFKVTYDTTRKRTWDMAVLYAGIKPKINAVVLEE
jgi:hypothetical protein